MDAHHEEIRRRIREECGQGRIDHLEAGLKGFGHGILGGVTGIVTQPCEGIVQEGIPGLFKGLARGVVGTVVKPAYGIIDLGTGIERAVKDSKQKNPVSPTASGPKQNFEEEGEKILYTLNHGDYNEVFVSYDAVRGGSDPLFALISTKHSHFLKPDNLVVLSVPHTRLEGCIFMSSVAGPTGKGPAIMLTYKMEGSDGPTKTTQIRCDSVDAGKKVCQRINYAKNLHDELLNSNPTATDVI